MSRQIRKSLALIVSIVGALTLGLAAPAQAVAPSISDTTALPTGYLQAGGAGVALKVSVRCPSGFTGSVTAEVRQQVGGATAGGSAQSSSFRCDGSPRTLPVAVPSQGAPWQRGAAFVRVTANACSLDGCLAQRSSVRDINVTTDAFSAASQSAGTLSRTTSGMTLALPANGTLRSDGATITVSVTYRCTNWFGLNVALHQGAGDGTIGSSGESLSTNCDGAEHTATAALTRTGQRRGPALLMVDSAVCNIICGLPAVRAFRTISVV